jgi:hypothetical protein
MHKKDIDECGVPGANCLGQHQVSNFCQLGDPLVPQLHNLAKRHLEPLFSVALPEANVFRICVLQDHVCAIAVGVAHTWSCKTAGAIRVPSLVT